MYTENLIKEVENVKSIFFISYILFFYQENFDYYYFKKNPEKNRGYNLKKECKNILS